MTNDIATAPEGETSPAVSLIGSEHTHEFVRYLLASVLALAADVSALFLLTSVAGISYLLSGALAFTLGLVVIYLLSTRWVFTTRSMQSPLAEFGIFAGIGLVGLALNALVLWILTGWLGVFYLISKFASIVLVFAWNFSARKWMLFH